MLDMKASLSFISRTHSSILPSQETVAMQPSLTHNMMLIIVTIISSKNKCSFLLKKTVRYNGLICPAGFTEWHVPHKVGTLELQQQRRKPSVGHYEVDTDCEYTVCIETLRGPISH